LLSGASTNPEIKLTSTGTSNDRKIIFSDGGETFSIGHDGSAGEFSFTKGSETLGGVNEIFRFNAFGPTIANGLNLTFIGATSGNVKIKPAATITNWAMTLPDTSGNSGEFLQTDGSGVTTWAVPSAAGLATTELDNLGTVAINTALISDTDNTDDLGSSAITWKNLYLKTGLVLQETGVGTDAITLAAAAAIATSYSLVFPAAQGSNLEVLQNDGSGNLSWVTVSALGGATTELDNLGTTAINANLLFDADDTYIIGNASGNLAAQVNSTVLRAGADAKEGQIFIFPTTTLRGATLFTAPNNTGNTVTTITSAAQAAARTYTIPDAGANASFVMTQGAQTIAGAITLGSALAAGSNKITGLAAATAAGDAVRFEQKGTILQVVSATHSSVVSSTITGFTNTGLTATITPASTDNKIIILIAQAVGISTTSGQAVAAGGIKIVRGVSTDILIVANAWGIGLAANLQIDNLKFTYAIHYVDSPSTTDATTYKTQFNRVSGADGTAYVQLNSSTSYMVLLEIEG